MSGAKHTFPNPDPDAPGDVVFTRQLWQRDSMDQPHAMMPSMSSMPHVSIGSSMPSPPDPRTVRNDSVISPKFRLSLPPPQSPVDGPPFCFPALTSPAHSIDRHLDGPSNDAPLREPVSPTSGDLEPCQCRKVPRPMNAFFLFRQYHSGRIVKENPNLTNPEISKIVGRRWGNLSEEERERWRLQAKEVKKKHAEANPDYQYRPRRVFRTSGSQVIAMCPICKGYLSSSSIPAANVPVEGSDGSLSPLGTCSQGQRRRSSTLTYSPSEDAQSLSFPSIEHLSLRSPPLKRPEYGPSQDSYPKRVRPDAIVSPTASARLAHHSGSGSIDEQHADGHRSRKAGKFAAHGRVPSETPVLPVRPRTGYHENIISGTASAHGPTRLPPLSAIMGPEVEDDSKGIQLAPIQPLPPPPAPSVPIVPTSPPARIAYTPLDPQKLMTILQQKVRTIRHILTRAPDPSECRRGALIAVEGDDSEVARQTGLWLQEQFSAAPSLKVSSMDGPQPPHSGALRNTELFEVAKAWRSKCREIASIMNDFEPAGQAPRLPVLFLRSYVLGATSHFAHQLAVPEEHNPRQHWEWVATTWRGIIAPDLMIYIRDVGADELDSIGLVEVYDARRVMIIKRLNVMAEDGVEGITMAALRRLKSEVEGWLTGFHGKQAGNDGMEE